jgi:hypothetical protein
MAAAWSAKALAVPHPDVTRLVSVFATGVAGQHVFAVPLGGD